MEMKPESANARQADAAKIGNGNCPARFVRLHRLVGGREILANQMEKNRNSRRMWYCAIFQMRKLETSANQSDAAEMERNGSLKFLGFPENFSGGYIPHPGRAELTMPLLRSSKQLYWVSTDIAHLRCFFSAVGATYL
jgi:hypothetical protein